MQEQIISVLEGFAEYLEGIEVNESEDINIKNILEIAASLHAEHLDGIPKTLVNELYDVVCSIPDTEDEKLNLETIDPSLLDHVKSAPKKKKAKKESPTEKQKEDNNKYIDKMLEEDPLEEDNTEPEIPIVEKKADKKMKSSAKKGLPRTEPAKKESVKEFKKNKSKKSTEPVVEKKQKKEKPVEKVKDKKEPKPQKTPKVAKAAITEAKESTEEKAKKAYIRHGMCKFILDNWSKKFYTLHEMIDKVVAQYPDIQEKQIYNNCRWIRYTYKKQGKTEVDKTTGKKWKIII